MERITRLGEKAREKEEREGTERARARERERAVDVRAVADFTRFKCSTTRIAPGTSRRRVLNTYEPPATTALPTANMPASHQPSFTCPGPLSPLSLPPPPPSLRLMIHLSACRCVPPRWCGCAIQWHVGMRSGSYASLNYGVEVSILLTNPTMVGRAGHSEKEREKKRDRSASNFCLSSLSPDTLVFDDSIHQSDGMVERDMAYL